MYLTLQYKVFTVPVPPLIVPFNFGEVPSNPGDAVVVNCVATKGDLPLEISWTFSSETVDSSLHRDIMTTPLGPRASVLTINSVSANHQGNYTCIVQNAAGRAEHAATLVVNGMLNLFFQNYTIIKGTNITISTDKLLSNQPLSDTL